MPTNPELIKLCKIWDATTDKLNEMGFYELIDYKHLRCKMDGDKAELRVGSAEGHMVHFDYKEGRLSYYDKDKDVNEAMFKLLSKIPNAKCKLEPTEGVFCEIPKEGAEKAFKILSAATSMDFRIASPDLYYGRRIVEMCKDAKGKVDFEVCVIEKILRP